MSKSHAWRANSNGNWLGRWLDRAAAAGVAIGYFLWDVTVHQYHVPKGKQR